MEEKSGSALFKGSINHKRLVKNEWNYNCTLATSSVSVEYINPFLSMHEDMEFARRTEEALNRIEGGQGTRMKGKNFLKELETW